jgi:hypothetical protein
MEMMSALYEYNFRQDSEKVIDVYLYPFNKSYENPETGYGLSVWNEGTDLYQSFGPHTGAGMDVHFQKMKEATKNGYVFNAKVDPLRATEQETWGYASDLSCACRDGVTMVTMPSAKIGTAANQSILDRMGLVMQQMGDPSCQPKPIDTKHMARRALTRPVNGRTGGNEAHTRGVDAAYVFRDSRERRGGFNAHLDNNSVEFPGVAVMREIEFDLNHGEEEDEEFRSTNTERHIANRNKVAIVCYFDIGFKKKSIDHTMGRIYDMYRNGQVMINYSSKVGDDRRALEDADVEGALAMYYGYMGSAGLIFDEKNKKKKMYWVTKSMTHKSAGMLSSLAYILIELSRAVGGLMLEEILEILFSLYFTNGILEIMDLMQEWKEAKRIPPVEGKDNGLGVVASFLLALDILHAGQHPLQVMAGVQKRTH